MINSTSPEPGLYEDDASKSFYTMVLGGPKKRKVVTAISIYYTSTGCVAVSISFVFTKTSTIIDVVLEAFCHFCAFFSIGHNKFFLTD